MFPDTPYSTDLGERDPVASMRETPLRIRALTDGWTPADFERSYGRGKWTARQLLIHLAQAELALGNRARMALTVPNYTAQAFDQDLWIEREPRLPARDAVAALVAISRMNVVLFESLSQEERQTALSHPEYGALTVDWIVHLMAGHQLHHLRHLEIIARQ